ncbi:Cytochrome P450, E-class, group I [Parasponia andersonii]|uniref:Cytochrome P450, E-class, group I n=1 Tax=Parasponia andersonii TaxID=3476 RepID=A0A2P5AF93_PARAD|nr:Cytochrome P450, E-class, group I [Parasponia andersonii]
MGFLQSTEKYGGSRGSLPALSFPPEFLEILVVLCLDKMPRSWLDLFLSFRFRDLLMRCALDSIFKVGFGVELNCLEGSSKEGNAFMEAFDEANALTYCRFVDPFWKLKRYFNIGSEAFMKKNVKVIDDFNDKEDILSRFLMESEKDPEKMNDKYLREIILNFMIAGKDSAANTLSWFLYMLCKNPVVQEKVAQEVRDVVGGKAYEASINDFIENINDVTLDQMHYLHAALTEALRLYPSVPVNVRCADIDDILPDGFKVKKGDEVYYMVYAMGRMPYIWGEDAEDFRPERWLNNGTFQPESPFKFIAFNVCIVAYLIAIFPFYVRHVLVVKLILYALWSGLQAVPRICLGKDFAYRQMKILSIALLHFFCFKLANENKKITYRTMFTLHIDGELPLCAVSRTAL